MMVPTAFFIITLVDLISNSYKTPMYWNTWTLFAMTAALCFFLCLGISAATHTGTIIILILSQVADAVTGVIFLLDALLILNALRKRQTEIYPVEREVSSKDLAEISHAPSNHVICCECGHPSCSCEKKTVQAKTCPSHGICECNDGENVERDTDITTVEKQSKTKTIFSNKNETVREIENEKVTERIQTPTKLRSTTSYGGTFPVAKNAAPLPPPKNLQPSRSNINKKKTSTPKLATSQTIVPTSTDRIIYQGPQGKPFLVDGTPLSETQLDNGNIGYKNPDGVLYNTDGIPIISNQTIKESSNQKVTSQKLYYKKGDWYTRDGKKVPSLHRTKDGRLTGDKFSLYEIETATGNVLYESSEGFLYNQDGTPIGYNAIIKAETTRSYEKQIEPHKRSPKQESGKEMSVIFSPKNLRSSESKRNSIIKGTSIDRVEKSPKTKQQLYSDFMDGTTVETFRSKEIIQTIENEQSSDYLFDTVSQQSIKINESSELSSNPTSKETINKVRCTSESTGLTEGRVPCDCLRHKEGEKTKKETVEHLSPRPCSNYSEAKRSRTVAISTRLVPKNNPNNQKSLSAPSSPNSKESSQRPIRSAEIQHAPPYSQEHQQHPHVYHHQYIQKPCPCGNIHYQTVSTVRGTVCSCSFHSQNREQPDPRYQTWYQQQHPEQKMQPSLQNIGNQEMLCIRNDCLGALHVKRDEPVLQPFPRSQELTEKGPLQTISECDCETDAPSQIWCQDSVKVFKESSTTEPENIVHSSTTKTTSGENSSCLDHPVKTTESDSAQTSETRLIKASDIQQMNMSRGLNDSN